MFEALFCLFHFIGCIGPLSGYNTDISAPTQRSSTDGMIYYFRYAGPTHSDLVFGFSARSAQLTLCALHTDIEYFVHASIKNITPKALLQVLFFLRCHICQRFQNFLLCTGQLIFRKPHFKIFVIVFFTF